MNVVHIVKVGCEGLLLKLDVAPTCSYVCEVLQAFQGPPLFIMPRLLNNFSINGLLFIYSSMISCYLSVLNESPRFCTDVRFYGHLVSFLEELGGRHFHGGYEQPQHAHGKAKAQAARRMIEHHGLGFVVGPRLVNCIKDCTPHSSGLNSNQIAQSWPRHLRNQPLRPA